MTKRWSLLTIWALAPLSAAAQNDEPPAAEHSQHEQHAAPSSQVEAGEHSMHEHMLEMREEMQRIQAAEDPAERQRLMHEHMQSMQRHMQMMGSMPSEQHGAATSRCGENDAVCRMDEMRTDNAMMRERMRMMEGRIESMQQLMREMMDHLDEAQHAAPR